MSRAATERRSDAATKRPPSPTVSHGTPAGEESRTAELGELLGIPAEVLTQGARFYRARLGRDIGVCDWVAGLVRRALGVVGVPPIVIRPYVPPQVAGPAEQAAAAQRRAEEEQARIEGQRRAVGGQQVEEAAPEEPQTKQELIEYQRRCEVRRAQERQEAARQAGMRVAE
jgi:hypothetical protein